MRDFDAVLFDMDGVIFDSERVQRAIWCELAQEQGLGGMEEVYARCIGVTVPATGEILRAAYGADFPWERFRGETTRRYRARYGGGRLPLKPGAALLPAQLRAAGKRLALASSTPRSLVETWLKGAGLDRAFDVVVTGDEVAHSKPDPEIFLLAAARLGTEPERCCVIEDSFNGVRAGHAAGMHTLMVPDLLAPDGEMRRLAEAILPDLPAVWDYLSE